MGLFDWLSGTKRPKKGVAPRSAADVHATLLALNGPDVPFVVRQGEPEGADLVVEWKIALPEWHGFFGAMSKTNRTLLRLDATKNEVRAVDQEFKVTWVEGAPQLTLAKEFNRGQINKVESKASIVRNSEGKLVLQREKTFSSKELKAPLQEAVADAGWAWRGVTFGKL